MVGSWQTWLPSDTGARCSQIMPFQRVQLLLLLCNAFKEHVPIKDSTSLTCAGSAWLPSHYSPETAHEFPVPPVSRSLRQASEWPPFGAYSNTTWYEVLFENMVGALLVHRMIIDKEIELYISANKNSLKNWHWPYLSNTDIFFHFYFTLLHLLFPVFVWQQSYTQSSWNRIRYWRDPEKNFQNIIISLQKDYS